MEEIGRLNDAFPYTYPEIEEDLVVHGIDEDKGLVVGWEVQDVPEDELEESYYYETNEMMVDVTVDVDMATSNAGINTGGVGAGGSMAAFKLHGNNLYTIYQGSSIKVFDISNATNPVEGSNVYVTWGIETLFLSKDYLYIGAQDGMYVYCVKESEEPHYVSQFTHVRSCDPVVVQGDYAYVTLRGGSTCGGFENQLDVIDISNIYDPHLIKSYNMHNPHGLGVDSNLLFICDGDDGLKVFDAADPLNVDSNQISHFSGIDAFDVIPLNGNLLMIGEDGLRQYDYKDAEHIQLLSTLAL